MIRKNARVLISYNDSSQSHGYNLARQLMSYLHGQGLEVEIRDYGNSRLDAGPEFAYQWLILIHSSEARPSEHIFATVNIALRRVLERSMQGILAVTTAAATNLPEQWATLRKYDASTQNIDHHLGHIWQMMQYAKIPYVQPPKSRWPFPLSPSVAPHNWRRSPLLLQLTTLLLLVVILISAVTFIWYRGFPFTSAQSTIASRQTATALATKKIATPVQIDPHQQEYSNIITSQQPTSSGFPDSQQWVKTDTCAFHATDKTYQAKINTLGLYTKCMAKNTSYKNFAYQVTINLSQGDAGGLIFRFQEKEQTYYRVSFSNQKILVASLCQPSQASCADNNIAEGQLVSDLILDSIDPTEHIMLTVIAQDKTVDIFVNGKFAMTLQDNAPAFGQIGLYAAEINNPTTVTFSDLKVWSLDPQQSEWFLS